MVLDFLAVDNFDFTRKIVKNNLGEKLVKMLRFWTFQLLTTLISREKLSKKIEGEKLVKMLGFVKIEFLDKNLTFRTVYQLKKIQNFKIDGFSVIFAHCDASHLMHPVSVRSKKFAKMIYSCGFTNNGKMQGFQNLYRELLQLLF